MTHPFAFLESWPLRWLLLAALLGAAALIMFSRLGPLDQLLRAKVPDGIFALEFAWSGERVRTILAAWQGLEAVVRVQTHWDYAFLLCYPAGLSLACAMLTDAPGQPGGHDRRLRGLGNAHRGTAGCGGELGDAADGGQRREPAAGATRHLVRRAQVHDAAGRGGLFADGGGDDRCPTPHLGPGRSRMHPWSLPAVRR